MYANKAIYLLKTSFAFENEAKKQKKKNSILFEHEYDNWFSIYCPFEETKNGRNKH